MRFSGHLFRHNSGSMILNFIIIIVIFASIISAVLYMSSSSQRQAVSSSQSANAWDMAEAGYRFLSTNYLNTTDSNGNGSADDEKAAFLSNVNGRNYVIPNIGSFTLSIHPYWFYNSTGATGVISNVTVQLPVAPSPNFTMPNTGQIKLGDTPGVGIKPYTYGSLNSSGVFTCTLGSSGTLNRGDSVYLVLNSNESKTLTPGSTLALKLGTFPAGNFPLKDGLIEIGTETRLYRYSKATVSGSALTLTNLQHSNKSTFSTPVTTATTVTFKKYIMVQSTGKVGAEQRTLSFNQAILDSVGSTEVVVNLNTEESLNANFSRSTSIGNNYTVDTLNTSGGGSAVFSIINSLSTTGSGANAYKCGAFWYSNTGLINTLWTTGNHLLSYDVQVKTGTGKYLTAGTLGLAIRAENIGSTSETYLGLTFMKNNLPNLYFTNGSTTINPGDTVVGISSRATGIVQGTPEITSGSWALGTAKGKIRFASVTGTFSNNEGLKVNGVNVAKMNGTNYFPAATDYIPSGIEPKPSDFSPARYNIGPLLLVLWERKSDGTSNGTFRWLAYKDISNDDYTKGLQDWNEPDGSCTTGCNENDGQIINDNASIYIRIQEKSVNLGAGLVKKVNDINLFYGDNSSRYTTRSGNAIPYDIDALRLRYVAGAATFTPVWVPTYISQWDQTVDFFSHIESGTPIGSQPQFQWDAVNPSALADITSGGGVLKICDDSSAACTLSQNGTLRLTELVTPDSGTYSQPEIGMIACGNLNPGDRNGNGYATAAFAEFALKSQGSNTGGFLGTSLSW